MSLEHELDEFFHVRSDEGEKEEENQWASDAHAFVKVPDGDWSTEKAYLENFPMEEEWEDEETSINS